ncbi:MAG TPA: nucleotidyltransferase family protein [Candidatus Brocadiia bacterium]|nr:nucleotidyltransferase domain-containing protein [Candidatus Brocadiales bacterium]
MGVSLKNVRSYLFNKEKRERLLREKERDEIISKLKSLEIIWRKYRIKKVYLYGSFVDTTFHKYSDIDIAIEPKIAFEDLLHLFSEINKQIERETDVRVLDELPFAREVKNKGILIYERKNSHTQK